jgi:DNA-directed RNA polymerase subunit RPC12/RpoP
VVNLSGEGRIKPLKCPVCGDAASEYEHSKWQCLKCGRKFVYELEKQPDVYHKIENVNITKLDDSSFFICSKCFGKFHRQTFAEFKCTRCNKSYCGEHIDKGAKICKDCSSRLGCIGCLVIAVILFITIILLSV